MDNETASGLGGESGGLASTEIALLVLGAVAAMSAFASVVSITCNKTTMRVAPEERDEVFIVTP